MITRKNKRNASEEAVNVENMTDEEFNGYIKDVENGKLENAPFRTFETEDEYQSEIDKQLGMNLRQANAEIENFNKIKEMAMVLFNTDNPDEAMYRMVKTVQSAIMGKMQKEPVNNKPAVKRISENGMNLNGAAGDARRSPSDMSDSEFRKYIDKLSGRGNI